MYSMCLYTSAVPRWCIHLYYIYICRIYTFRNLHRYITLYICVYYKVYILYNTSTLNPRALFFFFIVGKICTLFFPFFSAFPSCMRWLSLFIYARICVQHNLVSVYVYLVVVIYLYTYTSIYS